MGLPLVAHLGLIPLGLTAALILGILGFGIGFFLPAYVLDRPGVPRWGTVDRWRTLGTGGGGWSSGSSDGGFSGGGGDFGGGGASGDW